jgi:hemerythrin-like domain-containing protein
MSPTKNHATQPATSGKDQDGFEILDAAHAEALIQLDRLASLVSRLQHDGADSQLRSDAAAILRFFDAYGQEHHIDEEKHVFPQLLEAGDPAMAHAVQSLLQDHRWLDEDWREVGAQIDAVAGGQGWVDIDRLAEGVRIFSGLMRAHIAFEESHLYPRARTELDARRRAEMGREMAIRHRTSRQAAKDSTPDDRFEKTSEHRTRH